MGRNHVRYGAQPAHFDVVGSILLDTLRDYALKWDGEWHITLEVFRDLGLAFQLANIARDLVEDDAVGRSYLPEEWLAEQDIEPTRPEHHRHASPRYASITRSARTISAGGPSPMISPSALCAFWSTVGTVGISWYGPPVTANWTMRP